MKTLVVDVGGTSIKILATGETQRRKIASSPDLTPQEMVDQVKQLATDWEYQVVSIGYPGQIEKGKIVVEPRNLGEGWVGFDFEDAFGCRVKVINDAAMQALGSYEGQEMLFLGLGTGLGSALMVNGTLQPLEIAHLPYRKERSYEEYLGKDGLARMGKKKWRRHVENVVELFCEAFQVDYIVLGGGNVQELDELPPNTRRGANNNAFRGGFRMWEDSSFRLP